MASRSTISEDWEDVADDNLSVISLETSDSNHESGPDRSPTPNAHDGRLPATDADKVAELSDFGTKPHSVDKGKSKEEDSDKEQVEDAVRDPSSPTNELQVQHDDEVGEVFDDAAQDVDPRFLKVILDAITEILDETICLELPNALYTASGRSPFAACQRIRGQLRELAPILSGYANATSSDTSFHDIPIDPGLHGWLSGVRVKALSLQAEARKTFERLIYSLEPNQVFEGILQDLEEYEDKMEGFLPIMQVDFNEFQTQFMNLPIAPAVAPGSSGSRTTQFPLRSAPIRIPTPPSSLSPPRPRPQLSSKLPLLRQELYSLKDAISQAIDRLCHVRDTAWQEPHVQSSACSLASKFYNIGRAISILLSNNGSEWIDSGLSGGMTYAEFMALDVDYIIDLRQELQDMLALQPEPIHMPIRSNQLGTYFGEPSSSARQQWPSYPAWVEEKREQKVEITKAAMDDLKTLVQILNEMFRIQTTTTGYGGGEEGVVADEGEEGEEPPSQDEYLCVLEEPERQANDAEESSRSVVLGRLASAVNQNLWCRD